MLNIFLVLVSRVPLQENIFLLAKILRRIKILYLKITFSDEILNITTNTNFLKTFPDEFRIFVLKICGGKI